VSLAVYNVAGQKVKTVVDGYMNAGVHTIKWDGTSDKAETVSSGIYLYRVVAEGNVVTKTMILMK
jgi:flagellar hook assembly protein FlgD